MRGMSRSVLAAALLVAAFGATPAPAAPVSTVLGVDVSHWDGKIDWTAVRLDPQRVFFAIEKASSGRTSVDPRYAENRLGALSHGILVAAYHFAYPDPTDGDAAAEADHFVDTAAIAANRVIPALDLEGAGLAYWPAATASQLIAWTRAWLDRVLERTGIHALIYTSPSFWETRFADTDAFALDGYPLWIAHWGVSTPRVPAGGWAGFGWRCWQYTDRGRVNGVGTYVDMDLLDAASFEAQPAP